MWTIQRTAGPNQRPVSVGEAKRNLRLNETDLTHDDTLAGHIGAATEQVEHDTDMVCIQSTFVVYLDQWCDVIYLRKRPVQSITAIRYLDGDGNQQTLDPAVYGFDLARRQVYLQAGQQWPSTMVTRNAIEVEFVAGYTDPGNCPQLLKQAILLQVGKWFRDPAMESAEQYSKDLAYERIINRILGPDYP